MANYKDFLLNDLNSFREKSDPDTPLVDIEVHIDGSLGQVKARFKLFLGS